MNDCWHQLFQTTIDAFYARNYAAGLDACERLLSVASLPSEIELQTRRNLVFYAPLLAQVAPSTTSRPIEIPVAEGWSSYNPSIAAADDGFRMILRSANYRVDPPLRYTVHAPDGIVRTTNYLLDLTSDLAIRDVQGIDDRGFRPEMPLYPVSGFEDCRLIRHAGSWWASATVRDRDPGGVCRMALLRLEGASVVEEHLLSDGSGAHQKNWMPVVGGTSLQFVSSCFPTTVLGYDELTGTVAPQATLPAPLIARQFHGGSQVIPVDEGHLCLVHEVAHFDDRGRLYTHRWVWFDADWRLSRLSPPFLFNQRGVEFVCGLARQGDDLLISYGVWDREAWVATVPLAEVLPLLAPPLDPESVEEEMCAAARTPAGDAAAGDRDRQPVLEVERPAEVRSEPLAGITPFPRQSPSIVSTTLTGNSREIIGDALRSVIEWVDWCLVIDTGVTDDTLEIAGEIAGDKLVVRSFPWREDFAAARNFALQAATELGADWAVTLDTDERLIMGETGVRSLLTSTTADTLHVKQVNGTYGKERFFRLPARGQYVGPTHEAFIRESGESGTLDGLRFDELGKTHEQYQQKAERDIAILSRHTAEHPTDPRWFYYLGDSLTGLGRHEEAIAAFRHCASLRGWDEEGAWALYRAAECFLKLDRPADAVECCAAGMARHAGLAELPWLAAYASWQADRPAQATYWATQAIAMGNFAGAGATVPRVGFRHPPALWEGPYDVLRFALRRLGNETGADEADRLFREAKTARESAGH